MPLAPVVDIDDDVNLYAYAGANPLRYSDPNGEGKFDWEKAVLKFTARGGTIRNVALAGKTHDVTGVPFDKWGFPDFSNYSFATVKVAKFTGRDVDVAAANKAAGFKDTPEGFVWHHHQDGETMQLLERWVHNKTAHTGGFRLKDLMYMGVSMAVPWQFNISEVSECQSLDRCPSRDELRYGGEYFVPAAVPVPSKVDPQLGLLGSPSPAQAGRCFVRTQGRFTTC